MGDFFNNLLSRSGLSGVGLILQPRLPSLFEATQRVNLIPTPRGDSGLGEEPWVTDTQIILGEPVSNTVKEADRSGMTHTPPVAESLQKPIRQRIEDDSWSLRPVSRTELQSRRNENLPRRPIVQPIRHRRDTRPADVDDVIRPETYHQAYDPGRTIVAPIEHGQMKKDTGTGNFLSGTSVEKETSSGERRLPTVDSVHANPKKETSSMEARHDKPSPQDQRVERAGLEQAILRPLTDPIDRTAILAPPPAIRSESASGQGKDQLERPHAGETVVRVHIGRIEVRAVSPPSTNSQSSPRESLAKPRMSLEEYLRQREEKR